MTSMRVAMDQKALIVPKLRSFSIHCLSSSVTRAAHVCWLTACEIKRLCRISAVLALGLGFASPVIAGSRADELLVPITNPPPVQMLLPGFTVRELPIELNNLNNLVYAPDGRLFALGYDGNVHQLKDTDGDGLEDRASLFFNNDKNQILPSIGMAWGPGGLYIASQKRVLRLRDKGDGTAELETVTSGWVEPTGKAGSDLDSVGLAVDKRGNIFFGLGCDKWNEAYRVNTNSGKSDYSIRSERGTILKVLGEGKKREVIATGLRFPVSLAFNGQGDLFCTDQEGATWLPNGNPFDELLQIQQGRHYGFPPRHPKYLPGVIDEPSVFDYAPQHQSTCGLHFNEPAKPGASTFGPAWWRGDALVAGESRGKIWRTKLVKTEPGYVAQTELIACLSMLTLDAVPTPQGDLLVCCHSGKPDWGTGPQGKGKLFKISYSDKQAPQPLFAFAASPSETRVVFDRRVDPTRLKNLTAQSGIVQGRYVAAGDRFESFRPGYQVVKYQMDTPRQALPVLSAGISPDNRTIVLLTAPRTEAVNYAITIPAQGIANIGRTDGNVSSDCGKDVDLLSDLCGVEATWHAASGKETWSGWLPHLDLGVAQGLTRASAEHERLFDLLKKPGKLKLRCQLDLDLMLHPKTQPGAKLDYEYPPETVTIVLKGASMELVTDDSYGAKVMHRKAARQITFTPKPGQWLPLELSLATGQREPRLEISWFTAEDARSRAMPLRRFLLPWATPKGPEIVGPRRVPELAGGDWQIGKQIFSSEQAACSKCHQVRGEGGKIGPDLSSLTQRDYASVLKDILEPSAAINPDHLAYNVELKDGEPITAVILEDMPAQVVLGQVNGQTTPIARQRIKSMKPSAVSLMPEGLLKGLTLQQQTDLLTFLLTDGPNGK